MDSIILEIPFDLGIPKRDKRGSAKAPSRISKSMGVNTIRIPIEGGNFDRTQKRIENYAEEEYEKNRVVGIGGDHSISYGLIKAFDKSFKNTGLIYFDAHPDCQDYFRTPTYENVLRCIIKDTDIYPNILLIGTREITSSERDFIKKKKLKVNEELGTFLSNIKNLYVSLDIDVLDPKVAPGTGETVSNGLSLEETENKIEEIKDSKAEVRGLDLVEVCPRLDRKEKTVKVATELLKKFLTL